MSPWDRIAEARQQVQILRQAIQLAEAGDRGAAGEFLRRYWAPKHPARGDDDKKATDDDA